MSAQVVPPPRPIIVVRKRVAHAAHHGGAWKVAYADFVTAMMALFIVLWLMNSSDHMRKAIAGYFNDPRGRAAEMGTDRAGAGDALALSRNDLRDLKTKLEHQVATNPALVKLKQQIQIAITPEGLRIELIESRDGTFFDNGSAALNENGRTTLALLAHQLGGVPNTISVEGHTDARAYADANGYGNWELSVDRANAARRLMEQTGLRAGQISQVRGFADRQLRVAAHPLDPSNRRISVIVHYLSQGLAPGQAPEVIPQPDSAAKQTRSESAPAAGEKGKGSGSAAAVRTNATGSASGFARMLQGAKNGVARSAVFFRSARMGGLMPGHVAIPPATAAR